MIASGRFYAMLFETEDAVKQRAQWNKEVNDLSRLVDFPWPAYYSVSNDSTVFGKLNLSEDGFRELFSSLDLIAKKARHLRQNNDKKFGRELASIFAIANAVTEYRHYLNELVRFASLAPTYSHPMVRYEFQYIYISEVIQSLANTRAALLDLMLADEDFRICELSKLIKCMETVGNVLPAYYVKNETQYFSAIKSYIAELTQHFLSRVHNDVSAKALNLIKNNAIAEFNKVHNKILCFGGRADFENMQKHLVAHETHFLKVYDHTLKSVRDKDGRLAREFQRHYQKFLALQTKWVEIESSSINIYTKVNLLQGKLLDVTKVLATIEGLVKVKPHLKHFFRGKSPQRSFYVEALGRQQALLPERRRVFDAIINNYIKNNSALYEVYAKQFGAANFLKIKNILQDLVKSEHVSDDDLEEVFSKLKTSHPGWNLDALRLELKKALGNDMLTTVKVLPVKVRPLSQEIEGLRLYGEGFMKSNKHEEKAMGLIVSNLACELQNKLATFSANPKNLDNGTALEKFKKEFNQILNSKNNIVKLHRNRFMKIISDIAKAFLLTVTVIGLFVYKAYTGKNPLTFYYKHPTLREEKVAAIARRSLLLF